MPYKHFSMETINLIIIITVILLVIELLFFNGGLFILLIVMGAFTYFGWKKYGSLIGKIIFWSGIVGILISLFNLSIIRYLILIVIGLFLYEFYKTSKVDKYVQPTYYIDNEFTNHERLIKRKPLLKQVFYGDQFTENNAYEWNDINIHGGIGNRMIDLSNTVLANETAVISIRHFFGNITIYIPYDVEIQIHHSALMGKVTVFNEVDEKLFNKQISLQTKNYKTRQPKVKIITSIVSGNIEVKRL